MLSEIYPNIYRTEEIRDLHISYRSVSKIFDTRIFPAESGVSLGLALGLAFVFAAAVFEIHGSVVLRHTASKKASA